MVQVWDLLVMETNTYGATIIPGDWVDTYVEEMLYWNVNCYGRG